MQGQRISKKQQQKVAEEGRECRREICQEITLYRRNYRGSLLKSNNSIELSMIICVIAFSIPGISMSLIIKIAQDILF
uniref:Uncharacterized protein n=1 Tax=Populus trichocarpa TaxID=3694 RepID=A0A2K2B2X6_POPTR